MCNDPNQLRQMIAARREAKRKRSVRRWLLWSAMLMFALALALLLLPKPPGG